MRNYKKVSECSKELAMFIELVNLLPSPDIDSLFHKKEFINILERENIPFFRIRLCPICENIFWAKRLDSKTCGKEKCVGELSGKTYHRENKDERNSKKREKYYIENEIDYCKICVTPINTHGESECPLNQRSKK